MNGAEKRKYTRIFFSKKNEPSAVFILPDKEQITAILMDIGEGGMGLNIGKGERLKIKEGDTLILKEIKKIEGLEYVSGIKSKVRWIQDFEVLDHLIFGCEFIDITSTASQQIKHFINKWSAAF